MCEYVRLFFSRRLCQAPEEQGLAGDGQCGCGLTVNCSVRRRGVGEKGRV